MSRIVIVGGGIGGLSTAVALQRFGFEVEVYEQSAPAEALGAGTWVPPNGMRVLEQLELADAVRREGLELERAKVKRTDGREVGSVDFAETGRLTGFGNYAIRRSTLRNLLEDALAEGTVRYGEVCRQAERNSTQVRAEFEDGNSVRADLLVGADGVESYVRGDIFGMVRLRSAGRVRFRGLADVTLSDSERHTTREIWGGRQRFGYFEVDGGRTYWFAPVSVSPPDEADWNRDRLLEETSEFPSRARELIEATADDALEVVEPYDVRPLETWSVGRVVLVGDAAHAPLPNLGQGAAQALEDGWALAACLDRWNTVGEALDRFEQARVPRANRVIRQSRLLGRIAHLDSSVAAEARDLLFDYVPTAFQRLEADWLYDIDDLIGLAK